MDTKTGATSIRVVHAMTTITKPLPSHFHLPQIHWPRFSFGARRRKQTTIDLLTSSPYLQRDIGMMDTHFVRRKP